MTGPELFHDEKVAKRVGSKVLAVLDPDVCANCGGLLTTVEAAQAALFRHGGYGETKHGLVRLCAACGWVGGSEQRSTNPRRDPLAAS